MARAVVAAATEEVPLLRDRSGLRGDHGLPCPPPLPRDRRVHRPSGRKVRRPQSASACVRVPWARQASISRPALSGPTTSPWRRGPSLEIRGRGEVGVTLQKHERGQASPATVNNLTRLGQRSLENVSSNISSDLTQKASSGQEALPRNAHQQPAHNSSSNDGYPWLLTTRLLQHHFVNPNGGGAADRPLRHQSRDHGLQERRSAYSISDAPRVATILRSRHCRILKRARNHLI